jgi:hypothetical protein
MTDAPIPEADEPPTCAICGRSLWSDGLPPARDADAWICGDGDQARNLGALDPLAFRTGPDSMRAIILTWTSREFFARLDAAPE